VVYNHVVEEDNMVSIGLVNDPMVENYVVEGNEGMCIGLMQEQVVEY